MDTIISGFLLCIGAIVAYVLVVIVVNFVADMF